MRQDATVDEVLVLRAENARLRAEIEQLRRLLDAKTTPGYELLTDEITERDAEIERLRVALYRARWEGEP